jgi:hypothetical protein
MNVKTLKHLIHPCLLAVFLTLTNAAYATPPRYLSISDTPIAANETHLFMIRNVSDNEGSHYINNTRRFLVAQDLQTGAVDNQWLLDITRQVSVDPPNTIEMLPVPGGKPDLLGILKAHKTYPIAAGLPVTWDEQAEVLILKNRFELKKDGLYFSGVLVMPKRALQLKIAASLNPTMHIMPKDPGPTDPMMLDENSYTVDLNDCVVHGINPPILAGQRLVYLSCENGEYDVVSYQIYLTVEL